MSDYHGRVKRLSERGSFGSHRISARAAATIAAEADAEIARLREALATASIYAHAVAEFAYVEGWHRRSSFNRLTNDDALEMWQDSDAKRYLEAPEDFAEEQSEHIADVRSRAALTPSTPEPTETRNDGDEG